MNTISDKIIDVLMELPSECSYIDYKVIPYEKSKSHEFIRDIIAMLNSEELMEEDKYIIIGVEDKTLSLRGIVKEEWRDDNEWQNLLDKINPRPHVQTGIVDFKDKCFGYIYMRAQDNMDQPYEVKDTCIGDPSAPLKEKKGVFRGQAFTRYGSSNRILEEAGRRRLIRKSNMLFNSNMYILNKNSIGPDYMDDSDVVIASMIGSWCESYEGDINDISDMAQKDYHEFIGAIRRSYESIPGFFELRNGCWKCKNHQDALISIAHKVYDDNVKTLFRIAKKAFFEIDKKYELPQDKRYMSGIHKDKNKYSKSFKHGLAEAIAVLGNNIDTFKNCSNSLIKNLLYDFIRGLFHTSDWKVYATAANEFECLGEACPEAFLQELDRVIKNKDKAFIEYFNEKENAIVTDYYGYQLIWILCTLAKIQDYFSRAIHLLFELGKIQSRFIDALVGVILPWYPQTHASIELRLGIVKGLFTDDDMLAWDVLMKLMPRKTTTGNVINNPKYIKIQDIPENVSVADYQRISLEYIHLALSKMDDNIDRIEDMFSVIDDVPHGVQNEILNVIEENCKNISRNDKERLWKKGQDFVSNHRRFKDAQWALNEERLKEIEDFINGLDVDAKKLFNIRLFRKDQFELYDRIDTFEEEEKKLRNKQKDAILEIYQTGGKKSCDDFSGLIENKYLYGVIIASVFSNEELTESLEEGIINKEDEIVSGISNGLAYEQLKLILYSFDDTTKANILSKVVIDDNKIGEIKLLDNDSADIFWRMSNVWRIHLSEENNIKFAINGFNRNNKYCDSVEFIHFLLNGNKSLDSELVIETLDNYPTEEKMNQNESYAVKQIIKWLHNQKVNKDKMILIEWKYLDLLNETDGVSPICLWNELANNPDFFIYILKLMTGREKIDSKSEAKISEHSFELLSSWKTIPGSEKDGIINSAALNEWIFHVSNKLKEYDLDRMAMEYLGKTFYYAPKDKDGFFISRIVAAYLQKEEMDSARMGYELEAYNSRGVHFVDPTGKPEFELEEKYKDYADEADKEGYFRFAVTLRNIASSFHRHALENIEDSRLIGYGESPSS